ncbi:MAG TPA: hypothetical protein VGX70_06585 [Gemmataceae bacterium]|jgi:hypothetical protein|nr:hypothetical protein [Gemmataceae bacterium]
MSTVSFLCDECVSDTLLAYLSQTEPAMVILSVGQPEMPTKGTKDADLLVFAESLRLALLTRDQSTMPGHIASHLAAEHHTWGVFFLRRGFPVKKIGNDLLLIWAASQAEEWQDRIEYLPW